MTPLHIADEKRFIAIVKCLIEHGADINKENKYCQTPLIKACKNGNEALVKYLLEHGVDVKK